MAANLSAALVSPPVSGVAYQNVTGQDVHAHIEHILNPLLAFAASVKIEISPDNATWTQVGMMSYPLGITAISGANSMSHAFIPAGWYYRITASNAVLSSIVGLVRS